MAYVIAQTAPQTQDLRQLKQTLVTARNLAGHIQRQMQQMTDAQLEAQFGVPTAAVSAFRTNIDGIVTALDAQNIQNIMASLGFST
jgi:Fe2+ transport system protein B